MKKGTKKEFEKEQEKKREKEIVFLVSSFHSPNPSHFSFVYWTCYDVVACTMYPFICLLCLSCLVVLSFMIVDSAHSHPSFSFRFFNISFLLCSFSICTIDFLALGILCFLSFFFFPLFLSACCGFSTRTTQVSGVIRDGSSNNHGNAKA